jgi:hypothetical protein
VTDAEGRLVSGLTAADFELLENGKPQAITTFSAVDIPIERGERPLAEPDVRTNSGPDGRIYLIALDEVGTHPDRPDTPLKARPSCDGSSRITSGRTTSRRSSAPAAASQRTARISRAADGSC